MVYNKILGGTICLEWNKTGFEHEFEWIGWKTEGTVRKSVLDVNRSWQRTILERQEFISSFQCLLSICAVKNETNQLILQFDVETVTKSTQFIWFYTLMLKPLPNPLNSFDSTHILIYL